MKKILASAFMICLFVLMQGHASLYLQNDSPFKLKAIVMGANGQNLGEKVLMPQETAYFEDSLGGSNPVGQQMTPEGNSANSVTPYTVLWYCMEGTSYAHCQNVAAGAYVSPSTCEGNQYCKAPPPPPPAPPQPQPE